MAQLFHISRQNIKPPAALNQNPTCARYAIYVATCAICNQQYVAQTVNKFSKRWSAHRRAWNKLDERENNDQMTLLRHCTVFHGIINKPSIHDFCTVTFVEQPSFDSPDTCEDKWLHTLNAQTNIQNMSLERVK